MIPNTTLFASLLIASVVPMHTVCYRRYALVSIGQAEDRSQQLGRRFRDMFVYALAQTRVVKGSFGINHAFIFWSFLMLLVANVEFLISGFVPALFSRFLPESVHHVLLLVFDLVSLLALVCVVLAVVRRLFFAPAYLETSYSSARSREAFLILSFIAVLMLAYFGLHGAQIAMGREAAGFWLPVSGVFAKALAASPFNSSLEAMAAGFWWIHALVLLAFMNYLPYSKHMHILTAIPNCFFASLEKPNTQPREAFERGNTYGVESVKDFTWKDLFDSFSCTECGRCQNACPAHTTDKPLNPRQVIHDIKVNLLKNGPRLQAGDTSAEKMVGEGYGRILPEAIWACTTCGACLQACPVMIEHMPKIVKLRRHLVQMEAEFPEELLNLFENMEQRSNPWGIAPGERTKWTSTMDVKTFEAGKTEYLLYVGCAGAFDSRQKHVTVALATILDVAGVSWGILGKEEKCCGDSLRRLGNEFVFDRMAKDNVALLKEKGVTKIITQCPHCFTTLKNDYRQYGLELEVIHHSEFLQGLLSSGTLRLNRQVSDLGALVFHDSCYLGRHNDVYEAPRLVLAAATGSVPGELERNRDNSFCCGAGGGRMWMEEHEGSRINLNRVKEAISSKPGTICVSCPYCLTMFEDGLKDLQVGNTKVRDIAEVVAEGMRP